MSGVKPPTVRVGDRFDTNQGCVAVVVDYKNARNITVEFEGWEGVTKTTTAHNLRTGVVRNVFFPSVYGVGYKGDGEFLSKKSGRNTREYNIWNGMLERCYSTTGSKSHRTYKGCYVDERWHNFQNFARWLQEQEGWHEEDWQLDKDLLLPQNKVYSPETCVLLPREINTFLILNSGEGNGLLVGVSYDKRRRAFSAQCGSTGYTGYFETEEDAFSAYSQSKERRAKDLALKWEGRISTEAFTALMNYKVKERMR